MKESIELIDSWQADAEDTDPAVIQKILFKNGLVNEFLTKKTKYFIIASKGVGKTLLLKYKRFILEAHYSNNPKEQRVIFIPQNTPYLDFITDISSLSKSHRDRLSDYKFTRRVWTMSLIISAMSYYNHISVSDLSDFSQEIDEMCDKFNHRYAKFIQWCDGQKKVRPNIVFSRILEMPVSHINIFLDEYYLFIEDLFRGIHSGIFIFIDRLDQALQENSETVWINCQAGLIEAAWDVMRINKHVKIYTSMRLEAYLGHTSSDKNAISSSVVEILYSKNDLLEITNAQFNYYESGKNLVEFLGFEKVKNTFSNTDEKVFNYILRHTLGRPRDIISICSKMSPFSNNIDQKQFRKIVNDTSKTEIISNSFDEVAFLLHSIRDIIEREAFLALIYTNIMSIDELKNICREFNGLSTCGDGSCKKCEESHPFCDLYNTGLLGTLERDTISDSQYKEYKMRFLGPYDKHTFCKGNIIKSKYYMIHPALHEHISELRNKSYGKDYNLVDHILVGNNYIWTSRCSALKQINFITQNIDNQELVEEIKRSINDILDDSKSNNEKRNTIGRIKGILQNTSSYSDQLLKIIKFAEKLVSYAEIPG